MFPWLLIYKYFRTQVFIFLMKIVHHKKRHNVVEHRRYLVSFQMFLQYSTSLDPRPQWMHTQDTRRAPRPSSTPINQELHDLVSQTQHSAVKQCLHFLFSSLQL